MLTKTVDLAIYAALSTDAIMAADVPNPGNGSQPPGFERFTDILGWSKWLALGVLVACLMYAGVRLAAGGRGDDAAEHGGRIGKVLLGVIIVSGAWSLVSFLAT
jgi:hypothetical protein